MGWKNTLSKVWTWSTDITLNVLGSTFSTSGRLLSGVGGVGFAVGRELDETINLAYAGNLVAAGGLSVSAQIDGYDFGLNYTLPLHVSGSKDGLDSGALTQYLDPRLFYIVSSVCVSSGLALCTVGEVLKKWQEYRYDSRTSRPAEQNSLAAPSGKEWLVIVGGAVNASLTISMLSYSLISCLAQYTNWVQKLYLNYPVAGTQYATGPYYHGPLAQKSYPVTVDFDPQTVIIPVPYFDNVTVLLEMTLQGLANVTYGLGAFLKESGATSSDSRTVETTITGALSTCSYFALKFFDRTAITQRDRRRDEQRETMGYLHIQGLRSSNEY